MGLADFWDNITSPGFIGHTMDFIKEFKTEVKHDIKELVEEGQELFTDGFVEMVVKGNDYTPSVEMRAQGKARLDECKERTLEARGVDALLCDNLEHAIMVYTTVLDELQDYPTKEVEQASYRLGKQFNQLSFTREQGADTAFLAKLEELLSLPEPPRHKPTDERGKTIVICSIPVETSDKEARRKAARQYLDDVDQYVKTCRRLECSTRFDSSVIDAGIILQVTDLLNHIWKIARGTTHKLQGLLLLRSAIYTPVAVALSIRDHRKVDRAELKRELHQVDQWLRSMVNNDLLM